MKDVRSNQPYVPSWAVRRLPPPLPMRKKQEKFGYIELALFCIAMLMTAISLYKLLG